MQLCSFVVDFTRCSINFQKYTCVFHYASHRIPCILPLLLSALILISFFFFFGILHDLDAYKPYKDTNY